MVRTAAVFVLPAALVSLGWLRLEEPRGDAADVLWVVLLALAPALAPTLALRLALTVPAALTAAWVALDTPATDDRPGFFAPVLHRLADGLADFFEVTVPFSAAEQPHMHGVVVLAAFGFCLLLGHAAAARRPLPALLATIAGAGWPATLYPSESAVYGALILAAALWVLAGLRTTRPVPALLAGIVLVAAAAGASTSAAVAKDGVLAWDRWDPSRGSTGPVSVAYVWNANYEGIEFPKQKTTLLRIRGPKRGQYWRATTLDLFDSDRWLESPAFVGEIPGEGALPQDPLLPERARNPATWIRQEVEVVALADAHLVAAATPRYVDAAPAGNAAVFSGGVIRRPVPLLRGQSYTIRSFAPNPKPADLAPIGASYDSLELHRFLEVGRARVDPFGAPGRDARVDALFTDDLYAALWPYEALWREAQRLRAGARTPYGAVIAIETWLRSTGGFVYDESPPASGGLPPLAQFVSETKSGYCQHFAGTMALMLRFLGIPARVAAGFTSGTREDGAWTVTDHDAHTWVEVWFPRYGWLPFDPTPGRGSLAGSYSASSTAFNAGDAAEAFGGPSGAQASGGGADQLELLAQRERLEAQRLAASGGDDRALGTASLLVLLGLAAGSAIGLAKLMRRRARYLTRDPRRIAAAARSELVDFLADQGIAVAPSATPDELRHLLRTELRADARGFTAALEAARFGPPGRSGAAAATARRELRGVLHVIRASLGRSARLRGLLTVRSLRA